MLHRTRLNRTISWGILICGIVVVCQTDVFHVHKPWQYAVSLLVILSLALANLLIPWDGVVAYLKTMSQHRGRSSGDGVP